MAPPRAVKKSSLTTISQTTSRQGPQQSRRQVVEEVEEVDDFYDANSMDLDSENEVEAEPEASQSAANGQLEHLMAKMVDDQRKRYASKKKGVGEAYNRNCMTAQESINTLFDYHEQEASTAHEAQLKRLQDLLALKANIEATMMKKQAELQKDYEAHSRDLDTVIQRRIKQLK